jgi:hypothetical protein
VLHTCRLRSRAPGLSDFRFPIFAFRFSRFLVFHFPFFRARAQVREKTELVAALLDLEIAMSIVKGGDAGGAAQVDAHYAALRTDITPVEKGDEMYTLLASYLENTHAKTHSSYNMQLQDVFAVSHHGAEEKFRPWAADKNRKLLWHGSRLSNWVTPPPRPRISGRAFASRPCGRVFGFPSVHVFSILPRVDVFSLLPRVDVCLAGAGYGFCKASSQVATFPQAGILKEGLLIAPPSAPVTGYMFGKGASRFTSFITTCSEGRVRPCIASHPTHAPLLPVSNEQLTPKRRERHLLRGHVVQVRQLLPPRFCGRRPPPPLRSCARRHARARPGTPAAHPLPARLFRRALAAHGGLAVDGALSADRPPSGLSPSGALLLLRAHALLTPPAPRAAVELEATKGHAVQQAVCQGNAPPPAARARAPRPPPPSPCAAAPGEPAGRAR